MSFFASRWCVQQDRHVRASLEAHVYAEPTDGWVTNDDEMTSKLHLCCVVQIRFPKRVLRHDGLAGVRIGEASHPGPPRGGGKHTRMRKRAEGAANTSFSIGGMYFSGIMQQIIQQVMKQLMGQLMQSFGTAMGVNLAVNQARSKPFKPKKKAKKKSMSTKGSSGNRSEDTSGGPVAESLKPATQTVDGMNRKEAADETRASQRQGGANSIGSKPGG